MITFERIQTIHDALFRMAEHTYQQGRDVVPTLAVFHNDGDVEKRKVELLDTSMFFSSSSGKEMFSKVLKGAALMPGIDIVVQINEVWAKEIKGKDAERKSNEYYRWGRSIADEPDKREAVMMNIMTKELQYLAMHFIDRSGPHPVLIRGELKPPSGPDGEKIEGRFVRDHDTMH